jgi:hypothetical protein
MEPKPDESPPKRQRTLLEKLVYIPPLASIILLILIVSVVSAVVFKCMGDNWGPKP